MKMSKQKLKPESKVVEVKLSTDSLEIGMYVSRLDRPWTEVPILLQGLTIKDSDDIDLLRAHCLYVFIEIEEAFWLESGKGTLAKKVYPGLREQEDIRKVLPKAKFTFAQTKLHVEDVLKNISNGEQIDLEASRRAIQECVKSIEKNANALLWLTQIKQQDEYTSEHCLRVGILAIAFGQFLGLTSAELELLGLCGMLHDVGKVKVPDDILNKPGRLSRIEFDIMKEHTTLGKNILSEQKGVHKLIIETAHYHHERIDGKGYPESLNASYIHKFIRMISIIDAYDAITSARPYKDGSPAFDALKILFSERDMHFDKELTEAFIRMVGIYPPGTLVEMINGEIGIVVSANPNARLRPKVELIMTRDHNLRPLYVIDLANNILDEEGIIYAIKNGINNGSYGINIKDYILS
jgi:putative nucleotidyltransferase with HDIG domain